MTSTNEELPPPPKPRASPFDYRNTDLVSRLLAATPPYLYNMPLVPHSFFFSEMLRSLVQAKTENANRNASTIHQRRSRKRSWTQAHSEYYHHKEQTKIEKPDMPPPSTWVSKSEKANIYHNKPAERPLELTTDKFNLNNSPKMNVTETQHEPKLLNHHPNVENPLGIINFNSDSKEPKPSHLQFPFPPVPPQTSTSSDIILPPPPPVWYPPLYPTPYGIDPLHFFIDLRVSGHIYDRKNQKDSANSPHTTTAATSPVPSSSTTTNECSSTEISHSIESLQDPFKHSRHTSAFSVPSSRLTRNIPINLSNYAHGRGNSENNKQTATESKDSMGHTKFDVKSLGLEQSCNKISTNYVMRNIYRIYRELQNFSYKIEPDELKHEETREPSETTTDTEGNDKETEEEKEKRVRDLRALIGLELVVDYMNHSKPGQRSRTSEESSTDLDSSDSTAVDVVALNEETEENGM